MKKTIACGINVHFGDCDPAGIVFFPNFSRWMDVVPDHFFQARGLPPSRETRAPCVRDASGRLKPVPVPEFIRAACR